MATILSGITARDAALPNLIEKIGKLSCTPTLVIIQVGDRADSNAYISGKKAFAEKIGVKIKHIHLPEAVTQDEIVHTIHICNDDSVVHGIIVQLPLPSHVDRNEVIEAIQPGKDVDGLTSINYEKISAHDLGGIIPATARGVMELLDFYKIEVSGKKVVVVGRSRLVGAPIAVLCEKKGAQVTVCHSQTVDLAHETKQADVLIVGAGKPHLIGVEHVIKDQVIIDIGISKTPDGAMNGDVDFDAVKNIVAAISPVPGGVGPMTVLGLFENLIDTCSKE